MSTTEHVVAGAWVPVTIVTRDGPREVQGYTLPSVPGLAVTPYYGTHLYPEAEGLHSLTHIATGRTIASVVGVPFDVAVGASLLLGRVADWRTVRQRQGGAVATDAKELANWVLDVCIRNVPQCAALEARLTADDEATVARDAEAVPRV